MKKLDEFERLIVEQLRLELHLRDIYDEKYDSPKMKALGEDIRRTVRLRSEIWFEIIGMLRRKLRIKRLKGKIKEEAAAQYKLDMDRLNRKWTAMQQDSKANQGQEQN